MAVLALMLASPTAPAQGGAAPPDHIGHTAEQCPNKPGPCPNKPKPAPEPPHKPKPDKPLIPDLGLSQEDLIALAFAAVLFGGALWFFIQSERKQIR